ncbi:bolA family protein [Heterostelium album PN500]|uniref:BolA family protein n=1 Tax=Heterostelium pallidum (strain ATCC 26659 / Pp 5 / PN500) TaxID=670386 RepID=D3BEB9_HETP5|nr:bolA family protein [Heterostelium album PN500]EFA80250.1 bolA family protein [Heterostelium album PN500]|eukprot:XP_020432370.1 bolA family protein [Heterostelium album PN500]
MLNSFSRVGYRLSNNIIYRSMSSTNSKGRVEQIIENKLRDSFSPSHLEVLNESYMHSVPKGSETHFKVVVVSDMFKGKSLIEQHRMVNNTLSEQLSSGVHALSVKTATVESWAKNSSVQPSPSCLGGMKNEKK